MNETPTQCLSQSASSKVSTLGEQQVLLTAPTLIYLCLSQT